METVTPAMTATAPQPLPFAPSLVVRSYVLERSPGNLLVYGAGVPAGLGDVSARYLNHWHEAMFAGELDAPTLVHEDDRALAEERLSVDGTFAGRETLDGDFELLPIPGHTPGATAFLWEGALFTGDSIYIDDEGDWVAALDVSGSDRERFLESLELVRELEYDLLVPWAAPAGHPGYASTDPVDARRRIEAIIARVRRGENR